MARSKVHNLGKLCQALGEEMPFIDDEITEDNFREYVIKTKLKALEIGRRFTRDFDESYHLTPSEGLSFVPDFQRLFGTNLERIIQYGSSVNGGGKDIDLMIFLNELNRGTYDQIMDKASEVTSEKPVGIVMLPSDALSAYADCDNNSIQIGEEGRLIFGDAISFPRLSQKESIMKMYFKSGKELTSLRGALGNYDLLQKAETQPGLVDYFLKLEIWISKALRQVEDGRTYTKTEFLDLEPIKPIQTHKGYTTQDFQRWLYDSNCRVKDRIKIHSERI
jgi:hypothetical protein